MISSKRRFLRRSSQAAALLGMAGVAYANAHSWHVLSGNFLSFSLAGLPLADPLAALQVMLCSLALPLTTLTGAALTVAAALWLGAFFCSYVCPFGLLSEWTHALARRMRPRAGTPPGKSGFTAKAVWAGAALALIVGAGLPPLINQVSMPGWISRALQMFYGQGEITLALIAVALVLVLEFITGKRFWCRRVCPQSIIPLLAQRLSPFGPRVRFAAARCTCAKGDEACQAACSLDLSPRTIRRDFELECSNCGDCVAACAHRGKALSFSPARLARPGQDGYAQAREDAAQ